MCVYNELLDFYSSFKGEKGYIGSTESGRLIPYFFVGNSRKDCILIQCCIHAREYITTYLALKQILYYKNSSLDMGIYFVPMLNIDGALLCTEGLNTVKDTVTQNFLKEINGSTDFSLFKSNINGVDLNTNFDARWGTGEYNVNKPASANYIGLKPFSEKETRVLRDFTLLVKPKATISYHSKGEVIYWNFFQKGTNRIRDKFIGLSLAKETKYPLKMSINSSGGYKDYCIETLKIPSFTIEVGEDFLIHPLGKTALKNIYSKNKNIPQILIERLNNRINKS